MRKTRLSILTGILLSASHCLFSQDAQLIDNNVNQHNGTFVIRSITTNKHQQKDSAEIRVRFFRSFCRLYKTGPNAFPFFIIDATAYSKVKEDITIIKLKRGWHKISLNMGHEPPFEPFKPVLLKFKKRKTYTIDFYFPEPFPVIFH